MNKHEPVVAEQTAKRWKAVQAVSVVVSIVGIVVLFAVNINLGATIIFSGAALNIFGKLAARWRPG